MKTVVLDRDVVEMEVRPQAELDEYRRLLADEVSAHARDSWTLRDIACPGCTSREGEEAFARYGLGYRLCSDCRSLTAGRFWRGSSLIPRMLQTTICRGCTGSGWSRWCRLIRKSRSNCLSLERFRRSRNLSLAGWSPATLQ